MSQLRGAVVVNVVPGPEQTVEDYVEELKSYIDAAAAELGTVVLSTVQIVPADEVTALVADSVPSDPSDEEVPTDPFDLIEQAEAYEQARYV